MNPSPQPCRTWLITGGGSGIGLSIARRAVQRGDCVVINGRSASKLRDAAAELGAPERVAIAPGDVTDAEGNGRLVEVAVQRFGGLDVLVNNAGIFRTKPFTDYDVAEVDEFLAYLRGTFTLTQWAVRQFRKQGGGGVIINISTVLALSGVAGVPSSAPIAAKGGITALTRNLSMELAADRIRISAVAPGIVPTPLYGDLRDEDRRRLHDMQPLGRFGEPHEIAEAVMYLADAEWVTGVILPVDGGVAAGGDGTSRVAPRRSAAA